MNRDYRYEIKFVLNEINLTAALNWIYTSTNLRKKFKGRYVNSLYFDDLEYRAVRDNLAGISQRQKIRLRWYRHADRVNGLVLEQKNREDRYGSKNRFPVGDSRLTERPIADINRYIGQLLLENIVSADTYHTASLHIEYYRQYFEDNNGLRLTFDREISFKNIISYCSINMLPAASYPAVVMELKFTPELKIYVAELLRSLPLTPKRHSKYLVGLATFGLAKYT
ncbi:MAG: VTC domain-containing protein [Candidatus Electrothrix sp. AR1]|nr:VTC domain-containing protein [Candidatus Electrothrix sp. AR1]